MKYQTRSEVNGINFHLTLEEAFQRAEVDDSIWKISFNAEDGTRVRLIRTNEGWTYQDILGNRRN